MDRWSVIGRSRTKLKFTFFLLLEIQRRRPGHVASPVEVWVRCACGPHSVNWSSTRAHARLYCSRLVQKIWIALWRYVNVSMALDGPVPRSVNFGLAWRPVWVGCQAICWAGESSLGVGPFFWLCAGLSQPRWNCSYGKPTIPRFLRCLAKSLVEGINYQETTSGSGSW